MTKKFRFMTGLLAVVLAFVMLSSVAYIAGHVACPYGPDEPNRSKAQQR